MAPRVLFVDHSSQIAGAELVLLDLVQDFATEGSVWLFEDGPLRHRLEAAGIRVSMSAPWFRTSGIKRDGSLVRALPAVPALAQITANIGAAARRHDVIYANSQRAFVLSALASIVAGRPLVWHLHDIMSPQHFGYAQIRLAMMLANRLTTRVVVPSQAAAEAYRVAGGKESILRIVPNGISHGPEQADRTAVRAELGLGGGFVFGVFSRLASWKGQHVAIDALAELPTGHCVIAGAALFGEDDYDLALKRRARERGVEHRIRFLGHRDDVPRLMRAMDAVVHPSIEAEPFGRTMVEAMLCRVPVVAAASGAAVEILDGGSVGILVPSGNAGDLARALQNLRASPGLAQDYVDRAEAWARRMYGRAAMCQAIGSIVAEAARERAR